MFAIWLQKDMFLSFMLTSQPAKTHYHTQPSEHNSHNTRHYRSSVTAGWGWPCIWYLFVLLRYSRAKRVSILIGHFGFFSPQTSIEDTRGQWFNQNNLITTVPFISGRFLCLFSRQSCCSIDSAASHFTQIPQAVQWKSGVLCKEACMSCVLCWL